MNVLERLKKDEGFSPKAKWDVKQFSYGYGCRAPGKDAVITEEEATRLLQIHIDTAVRGFYAIFQEDLQKFNPVRTNAFINIIFNIGPGEKGNPKIGGLFSFEKTLGLIFNHDNPDWEAVGEELKRSKWYEQVRNSGDPPGRGNRVITEIKTGKENE